MKRYILDSYAMLAFFEDEPGADIVAAILNELTGKKAHGFMSIINWGELYYNTMREQGVETAEAIIRQCNRYPLQLIDADKTLTYEAAKLKALYRIAYADCFAAALALKLKAPVVTGDPEFRILADRIDIIWLGP